MTEPPRSSLSSSPRRLPPIARPDWPWATRSYPQRSQQSSPHPLPGSNLHSVWDPRSSISSNSSQSGFSSLHRARNTATPRPSLRSSMALLHHESTRQWSFTGFEWAVRDIHKLRNFVEGVEQVGEGGQALITGHGDFEILKQSPMLGDNKFKLEIAPTVPVDGAPPSNPQTLSLYITSLMLDFAQGDYEAYASMMAAVKCQDDRAGERGARPEWVWEFWQNDWVFRRESEVWECPMPSLSSLLENPRIQETDSFVICIQIHSPVGPSIPQHPSAYYVPKDLLDGLEASLDNPNTGDIRFVCLERYTNSDESLNHSTTSSNHSGGSGTTSPFGSYATARKRIIYAHSDILIRRSEYFATMLASSFSENTAVANGERKLYTVVVEEADFETVYWLLKYCYANWLLFRQHDDPRAAVEGVGAGWSVKWLNGQRGEWDWKTFHKGVPGEDADNRSATSGESLPASSGLNHSTSAKSDTYHSNVSNTPMSLDGSNTTSPIKTAMSSTTMPRHSTTSSSATRRTSASSHPITITLGSSSSSIPRAKPSPVVTGPRYPASPHSSRQGPIASTPDPHPHPTPAPGPASALAIYQVAHRYIMPNLAALALDHIMSSITPPSSFALLLATSLWDELHTLIEDFVVDRWDEVSGSEEFEQCCREVAAGEWGPDGGKTLMSVFRRLRSPSGLST